MKLEKLKKIVKMHRQITVYDAPETQWLSVGVAAYALYGLPRIRSATELLTMIGIPAAEQESWDIDFCKEQGSLKVHDGDAGDVPLVTGGYLLSIHGRELEPVMGKDGDTGVMLVRTLYMDPLDDVVDRTIDLRGDVLAVKKGVSVIALIGCYRPSRKEADMLEKITDGIRVRAEKADYFGGGDYVGLGAADAIDSYM